MIARLKELCKQKGTNFSALEKELGFANASLRKTTETINADRLYALAKYFDVSMEYLLTGERAEHYTAKEKDLIKAFRQLNGDGRATLLAVLSSLSCNPDATETKKSSCSEKAG